MKITDKERDAILEKFAEGEVVYEYRHHNGDFVFSAYGQGYVIIRDGENILAPHQDGAVLYYLPYDTGDFRFKTEKQGFVLIRDGVNVLEPHQDGKALNCAPWCKGGFYFETENQGDVYMTKEEHEAKIDGLWRASHMITSAEKPTAKEDYSPASCSPSCGQCQHFKRSTPTATGGKCGHGSGMMSVRETFKCRFFKANKQIT